jgi:para-aminobenzoate synthetase component I
MSSEQSFLSGAAIGYFGYDLKNVVERLPSNADGRSGLPRCWFGFYDNLLVFDHDAHRVFEVGTTTEPRRKYPGQTDIRHGSTRSRDFAPISRGIRTARVLRAKQYIAAGDVYQVNLSQRFQCEVDASATDVYLALRKQIPRRMAPISTSAMRRFFPRRPSVS